MKDSGRLVPILADGVVVTIYAVNRWIAFLDLEKDKALLNARLAIDGIVSIVLKD